MHGQAELVQVIATLGAAGRLTGLLDGRQEQGDQDRNDGDHHEQFNQGETATSHDEVPPQ
jgi:hypothetical protein